MAMFHQDIAITSQPHVDAPEVYPPTPVSAAAFRVRVDSLA
jgi:hypothetical protein